MAPTSHVLTLRQVKTVVLIVRTLAVAAIVATAAKAAEASAAAVVRFKQIRVGQAVVSLPISGSIAGAELTGWLHLHGAPAVLEANFGAVGAPGVLINVTLPGLSKVYADHFADPSVFTTMLREVEVALQRETGESALQIRRLVVSSFSAGFGGVRQLLRQPDAFARIDALVMADSIYCGYVGDPALRRIDEELMAGFVRFAQLARDGAKRFVLSHSEQVPEGYASTTETADYLIGKVGGERERTPAGEWPAGLRLTTHAVIGKLEVFGFAGGGPEDHMRHLRGIGAFFARVADTR